jgi:hypothetical protein
LSTKKYSIERLSRSGHVIKKVSMVQLAKEIQNMTDWQINNYI